LDEKRLQISLDRLRISKTDAQAWEDLYRLLWPYVYTHMYRRLGGNRFLAEESSQEVMLRLLQHTDFLSENHKSISFLSYVKNLCNWLIIDIFRKTTRPDNLHAHLPIYDRDIEDWQPDPEEQAIANERVLRYLDGLASAERALARQLMDGRRAAEIAKGEGSTVKTVQNRISLLRRKIRNAIFLQNQHNNIKF
jgi:RNA polymerase sigma factor (sigma-70 family)